MPDLMNVFSKRWKFILALTLITTVIALVVALLSPKKYLSTATALPANSVVADKAHIFNPNIEALYSDFGTPDELDRLEGTGLLDTIFIATAKELQLAGHYGINDPGEGLFKAAQKLKKNSHISRSGYGELKIKVWDEDRNLAAALANRLLDKMQELHQHLQNESNALVLQKLKDDLAEREEQYRSAKDSTVATSAASELAQVQQSALLDQIKDDQKMIGQYQFALNTNPKVLLTVENARASLWPDRPKILPTVLISFFASLVFSFLVALFVESRQRSESL